MFGTTSLFYEKMNDLEYIDSSISIGKNDIDNHTLITLGCDTKKPKELTEAITNEILHLYISEEDFERKRKLLIGSELYLYENIRLTNMYIANNIILYNNINNNVIDLLKSLTKKELDEMISKLDFSNISIFVIKPIKKEDNGED
jgi:predicted Zn-dependent peptidase